MKARRVVIKDKRRHRDGEGNETCRGRKEQFIGISLEENSCLTLSDLLDRIRALFNDESIVGLTSRFGDDCQLVEVGDVDFIRDGDVLELIREGDDDGEAKQLNSTDESDVKVLPCFFKGQSDWLRLNVGGQIFVTCRSTIGIRSPGSVLARMFASEESGLMKACRLDASGAYMFDRTPSYFQPILNYLRTANLVIDPNVSPEGVYEEAKYFGIDELLPLLEEMIEAKRIPWDKAPLTRRDVINALITTPADRELRFQGVNLSGADLSKLDLRKINFKYANMQGCCLKGANLSWCNLERVDMSRAILDGGQLLGVRMLRANLENASLKSCCFDDPAGYCANMEGVNLRKANLEGSNMASVNLRVATLKHANVKNCDLRTAVLAGADLEFCNLSGSDLYEANLRGANLKDTLLELMPTPLHMSQTIR